MEMLLPTACAWDGLTELLLCVTKLMVLHWKVKPVAKCQIAAAALLVKGKESFTFTEYTVHSVHTHSCTCVTIQCMVC